MSEAAEEPLSALGYLKSMRKTKEIVAWSIKQFVNEHARFYMKRMFLWGVVARLISLLNPWLIGVGIASLYVRDLHQAVWSIVGILLTYVIGSILEWRSSHFRELALGENIKTIDHRINEIFFSKNLGLHRKEGGKLTQENMEKGWNRLDMVQRSVLFNGVECGLSLVLSVLMLAVLSPAAGGIVLLSLVANLVVSLYLNQYITNRADPIDEQFRALFRRRGERWLGVERVVTCGRDLDEVREMDEEFGRALTLDRLVWLTYIRATVIRSLLAGVCVTATALYTGWCVWHGQMAIEDVVPIITWASMATVQIRELARMEREVNWCVPSLTSLREALELPPDVIEDPSAPSLPDGPVEVEFSDLSHRYEQPRKGSLTAATDILSHISFRIEAGKKVALLGPSGAGKSSLAQLLGRFTDPTSGSILINGQNLRSISLRSWRQLVGYIPQQATIFEGTLRDNLLYGMDLKRRTTITNEEIWTIMRLLRIDFGARLTHGLDTRVGRKGMKLSGGEAQRVMIGAAALRHPQFMIIDEATSSLDAENQAAVQAGIDFLLQQRNASAIIIAHRLSTVLKCDKFVVLKPVDTLAPGESQIECIAHSVAELFERSPIFRRLAELEGVRQAA